VRAKLIKVVTGWMNTSMQDLRRNVGIVSSRQAALDDESIAARTSSLEAGENVEIGGGGMSGIYFAEDAELEVKDDESLVIFSVK